MSAGAIVATLWVVGMAGCAAEQPRPPSSPVEPSATGSRPVLRPSVDLVDPGVEPRRALRYSFPAGQVERSHVVLATKTTNTMDGASSTVVDMTMTIEVNGRLIAASDGVRYTTTIDSVNADGPSAAAMLPGMQKMIGTQISITLDELGGVSNPEVRWPEQVDPKVRESLSSSLDAFTQLAVPLPLEDVGVGATWKKRREKRLMGLKQTDETTYRLASSSREELVVEQTTTTTTPSQELPLPTPAPGVTATIESSTMSTTGNHQISLRRACPVSTRLSGQGTMPFTVTAEGATQRVETVTAVETTISDADRPSH